MNKETRERTTNFTRGEIDLLVKLVEKRRHIFENKKSDALTWRNKDEEWNKLEAEFNAVSRDNNIRLAKHLRSKYETIKRSVRKKSANIRRETYKTGGGPNNATPLTTTEARVKDMILLSVEGMESQFDSDTIIQLVEDVTDNTTCSENMYAVMEENLGCIDEISGLDETECMRDLDTPGPSQITVAPQPSLPLLMETPRPVTTKANRWDTWQPSKLRTRKHSALQGVQTVGKLADIKKEVLELQRKLLLGELKDKEIERQHRQKENEAKEKDWKFQERMRQLMEEKILLEIKNLQ